ncbi:D-tyrosyl-tRNA(Tyr) deacylase [Trapelia coarctata]|nr:D-tyrosyl-tRNA(Tyr) deacylase [Trapelia coarctata]
MAAKVLKLKMWPDDAGSTWKKSVLDIKGEVLCVSQFTLLASTKKSNKPDFHGAASGEMAKELYDCFFAKVQELYEPDKVKNGVFQAMMEVGIVNDGPVGVDYRSEDGAVTLEIETNPPKKETTAKDNVSQSEPSTKAFELPASLLE